MQNPHWGSQRQTDINDIILPTYKNKTSTVFLICFDDVLNAETLWVTRSVKRDREGTAGNKTRFQILVYVGLPQYILWLFFEIPQSLIKLNLSWRPAGVVVYKWNSSIQSIKDTTRLPCSHQAQISQIHITWAHRNVFAGFRVGLMDHKERQYFSHEPQFPDLLNSLISAQLTDSSSSF